MTTAGGGKSQQQAVKKLWPSFIWHLQSDLGVCDVCYCSSEWFSPTANINTFSNWVGGGLKTYYSSLSFTSYSSDLIYVWLKTSTVQWPARRRGVWGGGFTERSRQHRRSPGRRRPCRGNHPDPAPARTPQRWRPTPTPYCGRLPAGRRPGWSWAGGASWWTTKGWQSKDMLGNNG